MGSDLVRDEPVLSLADMVKIDMKKQVTTNVILALFLARLKGRWRKYPLIRAS